MDKKFSPSIKTLILFFGSTIFFAYYWLAIRPLPFDSEEWKRARVSRKYNICYRMSASLVQKLPNQKISGTQLVALLGKPDYLATKSEWRYKLKSHQNTIFFDDYWLSILFWDEEHKVTKAWVHPG